MTKGAIFIRKQGDDEPRDATSPLEGYEYVGVVDGDVTFTTDGVEATEETFSADDVSRLLDGSMTATIEDVDEDLMRRPSGWTVLMTESEETRLRTFHRVYTWDYEKMKRTGSHECPGHPPTLMLPFDIPSIVARHRGGAGQGLRIRQGGRAGPSAHRERAQRAVRHRALLDGA